MPESLDYLGRFRNPSLQKEFVLYCIQQRSKFSVAIISLIILSWCLTESIIDTWYFHDTDLDDRNYLLYSIISFILSVIALLLCFLLSSPLLNTKHLTCSYVQIFFIITMNLIFIVKTIKLIQFKSSHCIPSQYNVFHQIKQYAPNQTDAYNSLLSEHFPSNCPSTNSLSSLVSDAAILLMNLCPPLLMIVIYEPRLPLVLGCNIPTVTLVLYSRYTSLYPFISALIPFIILAFLPIELHFQRTQSFLNKRNIEIILHEKEKNADITNATEMRHMIGNVAHDLKTPLSSFSNGLDLIKEILSSTQEKMNSLPEDKILPSECFAECFASINNCLTNIHNTNSFMLMTINRCIDYTKASKGMKLIPKQETVNLREVMQFPIECMSNIQERIGIKLNSLSDEICSHIITDKQWLQENLLCLLSNAVKYSTEGSVAITVTLSNTSEQLREHINNSNTTPKNFRNSFSTYTKKIIPINTDLEVCAADDVCDGYLHFEIEDTGIGLSEEAMKNLFNPFRQAQRFAGGTGLGLYSLAKRIEALKGSYGVRRRKDGAQGSLFWFALPYRPDEALSAAVIMLNQLPKSISTVELFSKSTGSLSNANEFLEILIVDDSPTILKTAGMMIRRQGHKVWKAENGEIALHKIEEKWKESGKGFDLILMDLQMPVMDGLEATRRLRMMEREGRDWMIGGKEENGIRFCHQLIIGLSANSDHETCTDALMAGVDDFFAKPFSLDTFNKTITRYFYK